MTYSERRTVVGYDGSRSAQAALEWAAADAVRRGSELLVLHVAEWGGAERTTEAGLRRIGPLEDASRAVLADALARIRVIAPQMPVTLQTALSGISCSLVEASHGAEMVVLGAPQALGKATAAVVARAGCPVVVVSPGVSAEAADLPITVGYDGSAGAERALSFAAERAAQQAVALVVVVAFSAPVSAPATTEDEGRGLRDAELLGEVAVARVRRWCPTVVARYELAEGTAVPVLARASRSCALVVVGNRGWSDSGQGGSVGNGLITRSRSALAVVH
ncbi:universal stress protein [Kineosporia babensis]|uniref:Universal stress protein n=1 Tax=Kineosporia babensis TaxID=499548 RepID=A0A9X1NK38_9ACTN|nr:universal stress protein [Kineosporia babensis]MCD5316507.1 universal stress protein [Kineosporia babensis]